MDIRTLKIFIEVMKCNSFTLVAKNLNVAPSSISRTIANLEKELGIKLFQRSTRKLVASEAGINYFTKISPLVDELELARNRARDINNNPSGTLRITASTMYGQLFIVPLLPSFIKKYPDLTIKLILSDSYLDLIEERIDVSIRTGALSDSSYISRKLKSMQYIICASPEYLIKHKSINQPEDIKSHNCLLFPRVGQNSNWLFKDKNNAMTSVDIHGSCFITNSQAIKQCTLAHMGLAMLPDWLIQHELHDQTLINIFPHHQVSATDFNSGIYLLYPSKKYIPLKTKVFIEHMFESLGSVRNKLK